jgi:hypothetical protein
VNAARWAALTAGVIALTVRPHNRHSSSFAKLEHRFAPLSGPTLLVLRAQYASRPDAAAPQRSVVLLMLKFAYDIHSGRVYVDASRDAECSPAVYDCALPRGTWDEYPHHLDPAANVTAAELARAMFREANRVLDSGEPIPHQPAMPEFFLAFPRRPIFERSYMLTREVSAAYGMAAEAISESDLERFFWDQSFESDGFHFVPQRFLTRQGDYPVHPVDATACPEGSGAPGEWRGLWYFGDGRWNPAAQRPHSVYASMGGVLGRPFRNPAFTVLWDNAFFAAEGGLSYPEFVSATDPAQLADRLARLKERLDDAFNANFTIGDRLVDMMRTALGKNAAMADDEDMLQALYAPHLPMHLSFAPAVQVVRYSAPPRPDSLTWRWWGCEVNLFSTKPMWAGRVEPAAPPSARGHHHGRAPAPPADR